MPVPAISLALALAQYAPSIMRFLGAGESSTQVAEQVAGIATQVTGATTPEEALERLRASTEAQERYRMAVLAADERLEAAYLADRASARARDVEVRRVSGGRNVRADVMIVGVVVGLLACLATLVLWREAIPGEVVGIVSTIAGIFGACLRDAFQFEFGSSRGSKEKDGVIAAQFQRAVDR